MKGSALQIAELVDDTVARGLSALEPNGNHMQGSKSVPHWT